MASIEFIQKRIEGKEKEIATLQKKLDRINKAKATNWEKNPYWYSERDLTIAEKDLAAASAALEGYKAQLKAETDKANSRNVTAILEFLEGWKARVKKYYADAVERYIPAYAEWCKVESEHCDWSNHTAFRLRQENKEEYDRIDKEYRKARKEFKERWNFIEPYLAYVGRDENGVRQYKLDITKLQKDLDKDANAKYDFIVERTNAIVGQITDASRLSVDPKGELNGFIVGTDGTAEVRTIGAGGYNIQCFHWRTLIRPVS